MYLNRNSAVKPIKLAKQEGFLMPVALFIIVIMGVLALSLSRFSGQSSLAVTQEMISAQTFYAAESGAQFAMNRIFYVAAGGSAITRAVADGNCSGVDGSSLTLTGDGLNNCTIAVSCTVSVDSGNLISFYRLISEASCGSAPVNAEGSIEVSAVIE